MKNSPMPATHSETWAAPFGKITVTCSEKGLARLDLGSSKKFHNGNHASAGRSPKAVKLAQRAVRELQEYAEGRRKKFTVPLDLVGTPFQQKVWQALCEIPYGETRSYQQIARRVGNPKASRAVGMANHYNPVAIVVPCHRVIASDGSLGGYAGGLEMKRQMLRLEQSK
jgi:O-6-methylguanine DNA methyltransferase